VDTRFDAALSTVLAPLQERLRHHVRLREEQARIAALAYRRAIPTEFRLGELTITPDRDVFAVTETRLTATWFNITSWVAGDTREPGVTLAAFSVCLDHGRLQVRWTPVAVISAHALGRRLERGAERTHAALTADLTLLVNAGLDGDRVPAGDGWWIGSVVQMQGRHGIATARAVRTFHT
jgi:hypothetical protein